jgi:hydrogenase/urease accessory protein HupE
MLRCRWRGGLLPRSLFFILCCPATARAHTAIQGLEGLAAGILHPLTAPAHLIVLLALGLLIGQRLPLDLKTPFTVFVPSLALALLLTLTELSTVEYQPILMGVALCVAIPVAMERSIPPLCSGLLFLVAAFAIGLDSKSEAGSPGILFQTLLGTWAMVIFLLFDVAYYTSLAMRTRWLTIGGRILGSWIFAISLLVLALSMSSFRSGIIERL